MGLCPIPQQGTCSLHPFSASRRFKEGGEQMDCDAIHRGGVMGLPPQAPPEGRLPLRLPSPLRGGLKKVGEGWIAMQSIEGE